MAEYLRAATERTENGSQPADIKAVGNPIVNGSSLSQGSSIEWDDIVDLGCIENAGDDTATITFASGLIVDLEPGEALFLSENLDEWQLTDELVIAGWECYCRCTCKCQTPPGCSVPFEVPCGSPPSDCDFDGDYCSVPNCSSCMLEMCRREWDYVP